MWKRWIAIVLLLAGALVGGLAALAWIRDGFSARDQPSVAEKFVARRMRSLGVPSRARSARNPIALTSDVLAEARAHFADHCATCHANDGSGHTEMGQHLYPKAPDMRTPDTQSLSDGELFYIIHNGIRFTGMPAWGNEDEHADRDSWKLVHFVRHLPTMTSEDLSEMEALNPRSPAEVKEEQADQQFLSGETTDTIPTGDPHHHHKETP